MASALLLAAFAAPAFAQASPACDSEKGCAAGLNAVQVFAIADRYVAAKRFSDAETLLKGLTRDPNSDYRAEARFRLSILREAQGDKQGAIEWLKALLDEKPNAGRPRLELARLLAETGDESGARRELRRAGAAGLPDDVARVVDRFATALRSSRTIGGSIEVAVAPDSNINRATSQERVDTVVAPLTLSKDARATSGVGFSLSAQGFARGKLTETIDLLSRASVRADLYGKSQFNDVVLTLASGPEFRLAGARVRPAAIAQRRWFGGDLYSESYGGSLNVLKPLDRVSQVEGELTLLQSNYAKAPIQDGLLSDLSIAYDRAFSPRFSTRVSVRGTRQDAKVDFLATKSVGVDLLASRAFGKQLGYVQLSGFRLSADGRDPLFGVTRNDKRFDLTGGIILRRFTWRGLAPLVRVTHTESDSTIPIYDFKRTRVEFALSREF
ncbi:surface lipoprotein assembly modifier [Sphingomonas tabacisoli]|uniref:Surface lipoprotein assembly modifier n=1 Tax=Sphingomonas tabacisoli TaxID=2249466 RepID=A0ABW4HXG5_9SPHN